jgi:integrase
MPRYKKKSFQLGEFYLGQRGESPAWLRCWYEKGRTYRVSLGTDDFETAKTLLTDWYVLNRTISQAKPAEVTMTEVMMRYWEDRGQHARSHDNIKSHRNYWTSQFGDTSVSEATSFASLNAFKTVLASRGLSPSSINHVLAVGKAALRLAWQKGELVSVPPIVMLPVGHQEPMGRVLTVNESARLLAETSGHLRTFVLLLMGTAARPGAVLELDWRQIDFDAGLIDLNPEGRKQNKKLRPVVRLPNFLRREFEPLKGAEGPVVDYNGKAVVRVKTAWRKARARAKLDAAVTTYSYRHTLGRFMRSQGVPAWEVAGQLGHRREGVTERYASAAPDYLQNAVNAIDLFFERVRASNAPGM